MHKDGYGFSSIQKMFQHILTSWNLENMTVFFKSREYVRVEPNFQQLSNDNNIYVST